MNEPSTAGAASPESRASVFVDVIFHVVTSLCVPCVKQPRPQALPGPQGQVPLPIPAVVVRAPGDLALWSRLPR